MKYLISAITLFLVGTYFMVRRITTQGKYNDAYDSIFVSEAEKQNVDAKVLKAMAMTESGRNLDQTQLEPIGGTTGILHIKLSTARDYERSLTAEELSKPETQIRIASKHLKRLLRVFDNDVDKAVMAYNAGEGNIRRGRIPNTTRKHIERFWRNYNLLGA